MKINLLHYVMLAVTGLTIACKTVSEQPNSENSLIGQWKLQRTSGGFAGKTTEADPSNPIILTFKKDGSYFILENTDKTKRSTYEFTRAKSIYSGHEETALRMAPISSSSLDIQIVSIKKDTLSLADNFYDGFTRMYLKTK